MPKAKPALVRDRTSLRGASPCAVADVTLPVTSAYWSHRFHMHSTFAFAAFATTGLAVVAAMSCAVSMWNMINTQIKTVPIRTGQNRRKQR